MSHNHEVEQASSAKTLKSYVAGFGLCLVLTFLAFIAVEWHLIKNAQLYLVLSVLAILQLIIQSVCFLGINAKPAGRWHLLPYLFTMIIIAIIVSGTIWVMMNLDFNMMN